MTAETWIWSISLLLCVVLVAQRWWEPRLSAWLAARRGRPWGWYLVGYPALVVRVRWTWRRMTQLLDLAVVRRPSFTMIGRDTYVSGRALRPVPPWLGVMRPTPMGAVARVRLHPGQTPEQYVSVAEAIAHAWRVHAVRVTSPRRGEVELRATARDPLARPGMVASPAASRRLLAAVVGWWEDGRAWLIDLRAVPHWLIVGATKSGKSNLLAALVAELAPQPVALVGIDLKGGLELSLFQRRLSTLASDRQEAAALLQGLVELAKDRMTTCRAAGVRSVWELAEDERPVPVVVIVDEIAELFLPDGTPEGRRETAHCVASLLRLAQLGRALGVHLVVAGQRVGSELGPGLTSVRAQLGGRVCHRVTDEQTAVMTLGDLQPDAVIAAQSIAEDEPGVCVIAESGQWTRARSTHVPAEIARAAAARWAHRTPVLPLPAGRGVES